MSELARALAAAMGLTVLLAPVPVPAQQAPLKMTLFGQPSVNNDSIWMAFVKGFYQQEGLDITYRLFPSGIGKRPGYTLGPPAIIGDNWRPPHIAVFPEGRCSGVTRQAQGNQRF